MTDTTDTKALREAMLTKGKSSLTAKEVVTIISELDRLSDSVKHLRIEASASDAAFLEMKKQYSTQFDRCRELSGKLEAEHQRAMRSDAMLSECLESLKSAEKELGIRSHQLVKAGASVADLEKRLRCTEEALKGGRLPVGYIHYHQLADLREGNTAVVKPNAAFGETVELFTAPQKPVVTLPALPTTPIVPTQPFSLHDIMRATRNMDIKAIEAAGGIVSTSDQRLMQDMSGIVQDGE